MSGLSLQLTARLGGFLLDVAFQAPGTGVTGLFGASASGKTTVLRCLAGLLRPDRGAVRLHESVWQDDAIGVFEPPERRGIGYVSQRADLFPHLTVSENLSYGEARVPRGAKRFAREEVVQWLGVAPLLNRQTPGLSGGERQRVAIARALLSSPNLLLMDEPLSALDEPARHEVLAYLEAVLAQLSLPVVYVSHSRSEVARVSKHVVWLADGRVRHAGPISHVLGQLEFAQWWGEESSAVLEGTISSHDDEFHLTVVTTPLGNFTVHRRPEPRGNAIRLQVNGKDVSIGLTPQAGSSILNECEVTVLEIADLSPSDCLVRLGRANVPDTILFARITRKSRAHLALEPGRLVFARVKSVAVLD